MFDYVIVCTLCYFVLIGLLYAPKCPKREDAGNFLAIEKEEVSQEIAANPPIATETAPNNLEDLSIRSLKKLAAIAKIKRYSNLTKSQLIQALRGWEPATSV